MSAGLIHRLQHLTSSDGMRCLSGICLRWFTARDAVRLATILQDGRIAATTTRIPYPYTLEHAEGWLKSHAQAREALSGLHWAMVECTSRLVVGAISLDISITDRLAHLGYWVAPEYGGRGFATQAARNIVQWAGAAGFEKIAASSLTNNLASIKVLERAGLMQEAILRRHFCRHGIRRDVACFGYWPQCEL